MFKQLINKKQSLTALIVLGIVYTAAFLAPFFSPYEHDKDDAINAYAAPTKIHWFDKDSKKTGPFIYGRTYQLDKYYKRVYIEDKSKIYSVNFFTKGFEYNFFGIFKSDKHFFGSNGPKIFIFGADSNGRDIFSRIIYGARISLSIGAIAAGISLIIGLIVGGLAGYFGGKIDGAVMRLCELMMMAPAFYLMLALRASFPPNLSPTQIYFLIVIILSFIGWASSARIIRGMSLSLKENDFVYAARACGLSHFKIIIRHILPHTFSYAIVALVLETPAYILGEAGLSLIGLGIQEPSASWGNMLSNAMSVVNIRLYPWILFPGLFILVVTVCFNVLGDALRDALDPKRKII